MTFGSGEFTGTGTHIGEKVIGVSSAKKDHTLFFLK
jgi:hypothetical protein